MIQGGSPNRSHSYKDNRWSLKAPKLDEKVTEQARAIRDFRADKERIGPAPEVEEEVGASSAEEATETVSSGSAGTPSKKKAGKKKPAAEEREDGLKPGTPMPGQVRRVKVVNRDAYGNEEDAYIPPPPPPPHKAPPAPTGSKVKDVFNRVDTAAQNKMSDWEHALKNPTTKRNEGGKEPNSLFEHMMHGAFGGYGGNITYHADAKANSKGERIIASQNTGKGTSRHWIEYNAEGGVVPPTHEESAVPNPQAPPREEVEASPFTKLPGQGELRAVVPPSRGLAAGPSDFKTSYEAVASAHHKKAQAIQTYLTALRGTFKSESHIQRHISGAVQPSKKHSHLIIAANAVAAATQAAATAHLAHSTTHDTPSANQAAIEGENRL